MNMLGIMQGGAGLPNPFLKGGMGMYHALDDNTT